jgi:hypothetical protein
MIKIRWIGVAVLLIMAGCNSSKITTSWKAENITPQKYNKVLVLGLIKESDRSIQEKMENHFVGDLESLGYNAVSSLKEYGPKAFDKIEEAAAIDKLKNSGVDAVLTIVLLDKEKERQYIPSNYSNRFWGYRNARYIRIYEPGYYVTNTKYFWESNFYEMDNQKLLYSVQTQSFAPDNAGSMGHEYGKLIVKNMVKQNILQAQVAVAKNIY